MLRVLGCLELSIYRYSITFIPLIYFQLHVANKYGHFLFTLSFHANIFSSEGERDLWVYIYLQYQNFNLSYIKFKTTAKESCQTIWLNIYVLKQHKVECVE